MSEGFKKLKLVDDQEILRLITKQLREYDPALQALARMKHEMDSTLLRDDLAPEEKIAAFKSMQQRFSHLKGSSVAEAGATSSTVQPNPDAAPAALLPVPQPPRVPSPEFFAAADNVDPTGAAETASDEQTPSGSQASVDLTPVVGSLQHILPNLSNKRHKAMLELLSPHISQAANLLSSNSGGELILEGRAIPGSSFSENIRALYEKVDEGQLKGHTEFLRVLGKILPKLSEIELRALIPRYSLFPAIRSGQTGEGLTEKHRPPGKHICVMRLYH